MKDRLRKKEKKKEMKNWREEGRKEEWSKKERIENTGKEMSETEKCIKWRIGRREEEKRKDRKYRKRNEWDREMHKMKNWKKRGGKKKGKKNRGKEMKEKYMDLLNPSTKARHDTRSVLKQSFSSPRLVALAKLKNPVSLLFTHSWRKNSWIYMFPKGISTMWNANSLIQELNLGHRVHFLLW